VTRHGDTEGSEHVRGLVLTLSGVIALSPDALLIRLITADTWTILWWRGLLMGIGLMVFVGVRHGRGTADAFRAMGRVGWLSVPLFAGSTILFVTSLGLTTVANTLVIVAVAPLFAAVFSRLFLGERIPGRTWAAIIASTAGVAAIFSGSLGGGALAGDLCAVATAACLAGHLVVARRCRAASVLPAVAVSAFVVCAVSTLGGSPFDVTARDFAYLMLSGLIVMPVSLGLITAGPRYLPAAEVALIMLLETVLGPLWVWMAVGEIPARATFLGGTVILATLAAHSIAGLRKDSGRF